MGPAIRSFFLGDIGIAMARGQDISVRVARLMSDAASPVAMRARGWAMISATGAVVVLGALMVAPATHAGTAAVLPRAAASDYRIFVLAVGPHAAISTTRQNRTLRVAGDDAGNRASIETASGWTWPEPPSETEGERAVREQAAREAEKATLQMAAAYDPFGTGKCLTVDSLVCDEGGGRTTISANYPAAVRQLTLISQAPDISSSRRMQALYLLGNSYLIGRGVAEDSIKGAALYQQAAEGGYAPAMLGMAQLYENGLGVPRDKDKSDSWYRRWARADDGTGDVDYRVRFLTEHGIQP